MKFTPDKKSFVRRLRENMTDAERKLWYAIRKKQLGVKFRRQQLIGNYIVDFVCFERKLVIEIDGGGHFESGTDKIRDKWFQGQGYRVLRFWNNEVLRNTNGVMQAIMRELSPSPLSPPIKGGELENYCD
ncbi:MAG: endonuclease domain-containing protein [candidate division WOR-3 bacterium]